MSKELRTHFRSKVSDINRRLLRVQERFVRSIQKPEILYVALIVVLAACYFGRLLIYVPSAPSLDDVRSLLSTTIQTLSGAIAIVVSLSLITVQLASQTYGPRILDLYIKQKLFWIVFGQFIFAIFYNVAVLSVLSKYSNLVLQFTDFSVFLTFASLASLAPLIMRTVEILKPNELIRIISKKIDKNYIDSLSLPIHYTKEDPFNSLSEIAAIAVKQDDMRTLVVIFRSFLTRFFQYVDESNKEAFSARCYRLFNQIVALGIQGKKEQALLISTQFLDRTISKMKAKRLERVSRSFSEILSDLGMKALETGLKETARGVLSSMKARALKELEQLPHEDQIGLFDIMKGKKIPQELKEEKTKNDLILNSFSFERLGFLQRFGLISAKQYEDITSRIVADFTDLIIKVLEMQKGALLRRRLLLELLPNLEEICTKSNGSGFRSPLLSLGVLSYVLGDRIKAEDIEGVDFLVSYISRINLHAAENSIYDWGIINELGYMGRILTGALPDYEEETKFVIETLGKIGEAIKKQKPATKGYMASEKLEGNLKFVLEAISSIKTWENHSNKKVVSVADRWLKKLEK